MRKVAASLVCMALASSFATAGTVDFQPASQDVNRGDLAMIDIIISSTSLAQYDNAFLIVGSNTPGLSMSLTYSQAFQDLTTLPEPAPAPFAVFASDLAFGGNRFATPAFTSPLVVGTLSIPTDALVIGETYELFVSSSAEIDAIGVNLTGVSMSGGELEALEGVGSFTVVPEPATLLMLGLGGLTAVCRRRK